MSLQVKDSFYITNSVSNILTSTKWSATETKIILLLLYKLDTYRVFLKKKEKHLYEIEGKHHQISSLNDNILDEIVNDIPTVFSITRAEFLEVTRVAKQHAAREIKKVATKLSDKKSSTGNPLDPDNSKSFRILNWFLSAEYNDTTGILLLDINPHILKFLVVITQYSKINFKYISAIDNTYALNMYVLCKIEQKSYNGRVEKKDRYIRKSIDEFKQTLNLEGKYHKMSMFQAGVLDVMDNQINKFTDLNFSYSLLKTGKKYTDIEVRFSQKNIPVEAKTSNDNEKLVENQNIGKAIEISSSKEMLLELTNYFGVTKLKAESIIENYSIECIESAIISMKSEISKGAKIGNIAGYLVRCIQNVASLDTSSDNIAASIEHENMVATKNQEAKSTKLDEFVSWCCDNESYIDKLYTLFINDEDIDSPELLDFYFKLKGTIALNSEFISHKNETPFPIPGMLLGITEKGKGVSVSVNALNDLISHFKRSLHKNYEL